MIGIDDGSAAEQYPQEEHQLVASLQAARPEPGDGLRRRVHRVILRGAEERILRRRAVVLVIAGAAMMALAIAGAISGPS